MTETCRVAEQPTIEFRLDAGSGNVSVPINHQPQLATLIELIGDQHNADFHHPHIPKPTLHKLNSESTGNIRNLGAISI